MQKLITGINRPAVEGWNADDWDSAVKRHFGRFVRRKSILHSKRELFRTELVNLAKIQQEPAYSHLLLLAVRRYRAALRRDEAAALNFLSDAFEGTVRASERWLSLALTHEQLGTDYPLHERVFQAFDVLDTILEGCYKAQLRILFGFAAWTQLGRFPANIGRRDYGQLLSHIPETYSKAANLLIADPEHGIPVNHWRNIAAHRAFELKTRSTLRVHYGSQSATEANMTYASLRRTIDWATRSLRTVRLANTIVYLEYIPELKASGLRDVGLRLESWLVGLCHNLHIVGFECAGYGGEQDLFVLRLRDRQDREPLDAVIHASQALGQLSMAIEFDSVRASRYKRVAVRLVDTNGHRLGQASVHVSDACAATKNIISLKDLLNRTDFDFEDWEGARLALRNR